MCHRHYFIHLALFKMIEDRDQSYTAFMVFCIMIMAVMMAVMMACIHFINHFILLSCLIILCPLIRLIPNILFLTSF